jgi:glycosyltransferase involved in cell wall biosynthesis
MEPKNSNDKFIIWVGAATDPSGYGEVTRNYLYGLDSIGDLPVKLLNRSFWKGEKIDLDNRLDMIERLSKVKTPPTGENIITVFNLTPENYFIQPDIRTFIGMTTFETDGLPDHWLMPMRAMDHIITYTEFNKQTFMNAGINRPIHVIPHGIDTDLFNPDVKPLESLASSIDGRFAFGSNFDWSERKNPKALLNAYYKAFSKKDNVVLVLKVYHQYPISKSVATIRKNVAEIKKEFDSSRHSDDFPPILLLTSMISTVDMSSFYASLNAYVLPSRGEGWSMTHIEAMSTGLPTIGTGWSGNTEYMTDENSFLVPYKLVKIKNEQVRQIPNYAKQSWADVDVDALAEKMLYVYNNQDDAKRVGSVARKDICEKWTWKHACKKLNALLKEI